MITKDKLAINLKDLKSRLPVKPKVYTQEHPRTINEALKYYCNQRSVHGVQACTKSLNDESWPLPLWFDPNNIKVGLWNRIFYQRAYNYWRKGKKFKSLKDFDFFWVTVSVHLLFKIPYDKILTKAFQANPKYAFQSLITNPILQGKSPILESIYQSYKKRDWVACISTTFPIIDFVVRRILNTKNLGLDVSRICKLFEQNGFSLETADYLMPHFTFVSSHKSGQPFLSKEREEWFNQMLEYDFGLIGPALSSFIRFANIYYSYYKEDNENEVTILNRHAILHGSVSNFGTEVNAVKLFTFLYLTIELKPVFEILFSE